MTYETKNVNAVEFIFELSYFCKNSLSRCFQEFDLILKVGRQKNYSICT